ncbi:MAG: hypothetical protein V1835_02955, partial [Candidatus Micrarchaeota archaeon]
MGINKLFASSGVLLLFLLLLFRTASALTVTEGISEDYSFRSGLTYKVVYKDKDDHLLRADRTYWGSKYPFGDPRTTDLPLDPVTHMPRLDQLTTPIGLKPGMQIVYSPAGSNVIQYGAISYSLAVLPQMDGKETVMFEIPEGNVNYNDLDYRGSGERFQYDLYGNPKVVYSLGNTGQGEGGLFTKTYEGTYKVKNPNCDGTVLEGILGCTSITVSGTSKTTLKGSIIDHDIKPLDNIETHTTYLYEKMPYTVYRSVANSHPIFGWTNLPVEVAVKDAFGRTLSNTGYAYDGKRLAPCTSYSDHSSDWHCGNNYGYDDCIITSPTKIVSYGTLGKGYFSMALDEIGNYFDDGKAVQTTLET